MPGSSSLSSLFGWTVGFEIETFADLYSYQEFLERFGFTDFHRDGSGPLECSSPPFQLFSERLPIHDVAVAAVIDYSDTENFVVEEYDEEYDEYIISVAGTHHHLRHPSIFGRHRQLWEFFKYMVDAVALLQPFFSFDIEVDNNKYYMEWTDENQRIRWAADPRDYYAEELKYFDTFEYYYNSPLRSYHAVTLNPAGVAKPLTLEIRICETAPHLCQAALVYAVLGFHAGVEVPRVEYYEPVDKMMLVKFINAVEYAAGGEVPEWARRIARLVIKGERPVTLRDLVRYGIADINDVARVLYVLRDTGYGWEAEGIEKALASISIPAQA